MICFEKTYLYKYANMRVCMYMSMCITLKIMYMHAFYLNCRPSLTFKRKVFFFPSPVVASTTKAHFFILIRNVSTEGYRDQLNNFVAASPFDRCLDTRHSE